MKDKDKDNICLHACLYAIDKLVEKGSCRYSWKNNDGKWNSIAWSEIMNWILERFNAKSEAIKLDRIKKAREEIENLEVQIQSYHNDNPMVSQAEVLEIIDKMIESEEK